MITAILPFFLILRPKQWIKNLFVLAPLFFSLNFTDLELLKYSLIAVLSFMFISSFVYVLNDLKDKEEDRLHPTKKLRPYAADQIGFKPALVLAFVLLVLSFTLSFFLPFTFSLILLLYTLLQFSYIGYFKQQPIADVITISTGYVLRVLSGCYAISVEASPYIILNVFMFCLFLAFGKRYHEFNLKDYSRISLSGYSKEILTTCLSITCAITIITYSIYVIDISQKLNKPFLIYTVIFVVFGLFRYLQSIYLKNNSGSPENALTKDPILFLNFLIWFIVIIWILYI